MGTPRDFISSGIADMLLPLFRRSMEDAVYETLDSRQIPTRSDFKEVRDLVNNLRGQVTGTTNGIERIMARIDALEARVVAIESQATVESATNLSESKTCKVDGCTDPYRSKGFCGRHYQAWRRGSLAGFPPA
jgi:hypothetical protein